MFVVLRDLSDSDPGTRYYKKIGKNDSNLPYIVTTDNINDAELFQITIPRNELCITPEIPYGHWELQAVRVELIR